MAKNGGHKCLATKRLGAYEEVGRKTDDRGRTTDAVLIDNRLTRFGWLCGEDLPAGCRNICIPVDDVIAVKVGVNAGE